MAAVSRKCVVMFGKWSLLDVQTVNVWPLCHLSISPYLGLHPFQQVCHFLRNRGGNVTPELERDSHRLKYMSLRSPIMWEEPHHWLGRLTAELQEERCQRSHCNLEGRGLRDEVRQRAPPSAEDRHQAAMTSPLLAGDVSGIEIGNRGYDNMHMLGNN